MLNKIFYHARREVRVFFIATAEPLRTEKATEEPEANATGTAAEEPEADATGTAAGEAAAEPLRTEKERLFTKYKDYERVIEVMESRLRGGRFFK